MADACCDTIVGGQIYITVEDKIFEATGDVEIDPSRTEREAGVSANGRLSVTERAVPQMARITFLNFCGDSDPMQLWNYRCNMDITVVEASRGIRHLFTKASVVGKPTKNLSNGQVSGMEFATDKYSQA